jgi:hypothetical protein
MTQTTTDVPESETLGEYCDRARDRGLDRKSDFRAAEGELTRSHQLRRDYNRLHHGETEGTITLTVRMYSEYHKTVGPAEERGTLLEEVAETVQTGEWVVIEGPESRQRVCVRGIDESGDYAAISGDGWEGDHWREISHDGWITRPRFTRSIPEGKLEVSATIERIGEGD